MPNTPVSPKVTAGINWGIIATLAVGVLTSVTPQMLSGLGSYQSMVWVLIGSGLTALRAYLKADPLRDAALAQAASDTPAETPSAAVGTSASSLPEPPAVDPAPVEAAPEAAPAVTPAQ